MSDEQRPRPEDGPDDDRPSRDWRFDETSQYEPVRDGRSSGPAEPPDATAKMPSAGDAGAGGDTGAGGDRTQMVPKPAADQTRQISPIEADAAWSGRAQGRGPRAQDATTVGGWGASAEPAPVEPRGRWWLPILWGLLALIVVAALILGGWLITRSSDNGTITPAATTAPAAPPPTPSSASPTSSSPSPSPSKPSPTVARVKVPKLVGLTSGKALQLLDKVGLSYRITQGPGDGPVGTVVASDPGEGVAVPPDTEVQLLVVDRPQSTTPSPEPSVDEQQPED